MLTTFITYHNLLLRIVFLGPHLDSMVSYMNQTTQQQDKSFLVLHHHPSILATQYSLQPILVPQCQDPLLLRDKSNPACFFNANRLAKVAWRPVQKEAPQLFNFLRIFSFLPEEYSELLELYSMKTLERSMRKGNKEDIEREVACDWLKSQNTNERGEGRNSWLDQQRKLLKVQEKPKLYIGGIFPLSGRKYKSPLLAEGG